MTRVAVLRQRREFTLLIVTGETHSVCLRSRRFGLKRFMTTSALRIFVFFVWKLHLKIGNKSLAFDRREKRFAQTWKRIARSVAWRCFHVAVGADPRNGPFACEELLAVTVQASLVLRKLRHIRKRVIRLAHLFPVL